MTSARRPPKVEVPSDLDGDGKPICRTAMEAQG